MYTKIGIDHHVMELLIQYEFFHYQPFISLNETTFSSGTVFRRQNLTSKDVRYRRLKTIPALKKIKINYKCRISITY